MTEAESEPPEPPSSPPRACDQVGDVTLDLLDPGHRLDPEAGAWLRATAARAIGALDARGSVRVRLVGDTEMSDAHERWLGEATTTDVITFDLTDGASASSRELDADLTVCVDEARRQAATRGHEPEREMLLYTVHGVLHCLGHDDHTPEGAETMHRIEDELLRRIGVGTTFAAGADSGRSGHRKGPR